MNGPLLSRSIGKRRSATQTQGGNDGNVAQMDKVLFDGKARSGNNEQNTKIQKETQFTMNGNIRRNSL